MMEKTKHDGKTVKFRYGKLYIDGSVFRANMPHVGQDSPSTSQTSASSIASDATSGGNNNTNSK